MNIRLKSLVQSRVLKGSPGARPVLNLENIESGSPQLLGELSYSYSGDLLAFEPGDVLFSKLRPYLSKSFLVDRPLLGTGEFLCLVSSPELDAGFLLYLTLSRPWIEWSMQSSYGTKMPRTSWDLMSEYRLDLPRIDQQRRVVDFLRGQVDALDQAVKLREKQTDIMAMRAWTFFDATVRGLTNLRTPLSRYLTLAADGPFGSAFSSSDYTTEGPAVIRLGNISFAAFEASEIARVPASIWEQFPRCQVQPGDLLIASLGDARNHAGRACVAPESLGPAMVKGKCFRAQVDTRKADVNFLALAMSSPRGAELLSLETRGSTRSMINLDILKSVRLPIPDLPAQRKIAQEMTSMREAEQHQIALLGRSITLLKERKQALITAAVTGQLDVTTARSGLGVDVP